MTIPSSTQVPSIPVPWKPSRVVLLALGAILALPAPVEGLDPPLTDPEIVYGPAVRLGDGSARTYVIVESERPLEVGVAVDQAFLTSLPEDGAPGGLVMPNGHSMFEYALEMPEGHGTPFQHATLDWIPAGHEPPGIYDKPHFDVHFYTISAEERRAIRPDDPTFLEKGARLPEAEFVPAGFVDPGMGAVPMMGVHLVDPTSPELRAEAPEPFTHTFLYGSWDGRLIFLEPMVTTAFLAEKHDLSFPIAVAERYDPEGYYPASYSIRWDDAAGEYRISLTDLAWRGGS